MTGSDVGRLGSVFLHVGGGSGGSGGGAWRIDHVDVRKLPCRGGDGGSGGGVAGVFGEDEAPAAVRFVRRDTSGVRRAVTLDARHASEDAP
eukprot:359130-Chlamydomonas_euryale.AAC.4